MSDISSMVRLTFSNIVRGPADGELEIEYNPAPDLLEMEPSNSQVYQNRVYSVSSRRSGAKPAPEPKKHSKKSSPPSCSYDSDFETPKR
jgi:hypothetical protein